MDSSLDLDAILSRNRQAYGEIAEQFGGDADFLPTAVVDHFGHDVLALVNEIRRLREQAWSVPKVRHDENAAVGPNIIGSWIHRAAGQSDVEHTREYAAQMLAAAAELERRQAADARQHAGLSLPCDRCGGPCRIDNEQEA